MKPALWEFVDPAHLYAYDLDVFGTHSLFQYVNRTCTEPGKRLLANWLGQHLEKKEDILERQAAVRELAPELQFRQHFRILGMLHKGTAADETELKAWAASPGVFRKNKFLRLLPVTVAGRRAENTRVTAGYSGKNTSRSRASPTFV